MAKNPLKRLFLIVFLVAIFSALVPSVSFARTLVPSIIPGGMWNSPANGFSVTQGSSLKLSANAYPTNPGDPKIAYVQFTAYWNGLTSSQWPVIAKVVYPTAGTNTFTYTWNLTYQGKPITSGAIEVSFDVYDNAGNVNLAPNGVHYGD